jgi:hypothetical protein
MWVRRRPEIERQSVSDSVNFLGTNNGLPFS